MKICDFSLFKSDREGKGHGGVCIYLLLFQCLVLYVNNVEAFVIKIRDLDTVMFMIYCLLEASVYSFKEVLDKVKESVDFAQCHSSWYSTVCSCGDLNLPNID